MNLFWERGYDSVGMSDLESRTGLNRSSLYNSFGSKEVLFALALEHYTKHLAYRMFDSLRSGRNGLADIETFLKQLAQHLRTQTGRGCFMVNTMAGAPRSPEGQALAKRYIAAFLEAVRAALERAAQRGEIREEAVDSDANLLLGAVIGANLLARASQPQQLVDSVIDAALQHIRPA